MYYTQSINIILRNEGYTNSELPMLLTDLLESSYAFRKPWLGERSLRFLLAYQGTNDEPLPLQIDTLTQMADWKLLFSRSRTVSEAALDLYERVYRLAASQQRLEPVSDAFFSPEIPVVLPAFLPNPLATEQTAATRGHIDVAFDVTQFGKSKRIDVIDMAQNATRADKRALVHLILRSRFRPQVVDGEFDKTRVAFRYYLND
jgi:hypothetical protein